MTDNSVPASDSSINSSMMRLRAGIPLKFRSMANDASEREVELQLLGITKRQTDIALHLAINDRPRVKKRTGEHNAPASIKGRNIRKVLTASSK